MVGPPQADRVAGIAPFVCGMEHGDRLKNARHFAVYHVLGKKDGAWFVETARKNVERLREAGGPLEAVEMDGGHDVFPGECAKALAWLAARPRNFWAKDVRWHPDPDRTSGGFFWIDPWATTACGAFSAKVEGNAVTIDGHRPESIALSDALVDLDRPVTVSIGGTVVFDGQVSRTMRTALEWVESKRDFSAVPVARVTIPR
jgi:hypothetical protein